MARSSSENWNQRKKITRIIEFVRAVDRYEASGIESLQNDKTAQIDR